MGEGAKTDMKLRSSYSHWTTVTIRYSDQDPMGHVNNVVVAQFIESGRTQLFYDLNQKLGESSTSFVLANLNIDYWQEILYPGSVDVGTSILKIGNKSLVTGYGIFQGDTCFVTSTSINVFFDKSIRKSVTPTDRMRALIESYIN